MDIDGALQLANQLPTGSESEERIYESRFDAWQKALDELFGEFNGKLPMVLFFSEKITSGGLPGGVHG